MRRTRVLKTIGIGCLLVVAVLAWACGSPAAPAGTPTKAPAGAASPAAGVTKPPGAAAVPAPYAGQKDPFTPKDAAAVKAGETIYKLRCVACHGEKGDGKGPAAAGLNPAPANFTASPFKEKFTTAQDELFWRVSEGWPGTSMPAFKGQLSDQERWQVITYAWHLGTGE